MLTALDAREDALDQFEKPFVAKIREHGWYRTHVLEEGQEPSFSYTTGFWVHTNQPELLMFGMPSAVHDVFWDLYRDAQQGISLQVGKRSDRVFGNLPAYVFRVAQKHYRDILGWSRCFTPETNSRACSLFGQTAMAPFLGKRDLTQRSRIDRST